MIGYKGLNKDYTAYTGFKYEIGKTYELHKDEKLKICQCGFHFCKNPIDVYGYCPDNDNDTFIIVEVEALGEIVHEATKYATNKIKILREYTKEELDKLISDNKHNTGNYNTGDYNVGSLNSGNRNTGEYNSGNYNTSYYNSGNFNSGNNNTGDYNTGFCNTGNYNSGCFNSGSCNTGSCNAGMYNSGDCNYGKHNTGNYNSGCYNSGCFNTDEPKMRMFNKTCDMTYNEFLWSIDYSFTYLCYRIYDKDLLPEDRARIEALPNYDPDIFTELTGIKFD